MGILGQGGAQGLAQGLQGGMSLYGQYQGIQQQKDMMELQRQAQEFKIKEQKIRLDQMKLEKERREKQEQAMGLLGNYLGGQQPLPQVSPGMQPGIQGGAPRGSDMMPASTTVQPTAQRALPMAMRAGQPGMQAFEAAIETGVIPTKTGDSTLDQLKLLRAKQQYEAGEVKRKETEFRQGLAMRWMGEGTPDSVAAGQAVLGGDYKAALQIKYPKYFSLSKVDLARLLEKGDPEAAGMLQSLREMESKGGINVETRPDGTMSVSIGKTESNPIYPYREAIKDRKDLGSLDGSVAIINDLRNMIQEFPDLVGPGSTATIQWNNIVTWGNRILGKETKNTLLSEKATNAQKIQTLTGDLKTQLLKSLSGSISDKELKFITDRLGGDDGLFTLTTAKQRLAALDAIQSTVEIAREEVLTRRRYFEETAPKVKKPVTRLDRKINALIGEPKNIPAGGPVPVGKEPNTTEIQKRINQMSEERRRRRLEELLRKQRGG